MWVADAPVAVSLEVGSAKSCLVYAVVAVRRVAAGSSVEAVVEVVAVKDMVRPSTHACRSHTRVEVAAGSCHTLTEDERTYP